MDGKGSHRTCGICGAKERHKHNNKCLLFAAFPLNEDRCREWLRVVGNEELVHLPIEKLNKKCHVCGHHFQKKYFNKKGNRLKKHAIPVLHLTAAPLSDNQLCEFPQYMWKDTAASLPEELPSTSKSTHIDVAAKQLLDAPLHEEVPSTIKQDPIDSVENSKTETMPKKSTKMHVVTDVSDSQVRGVKRKLEESMELTPRKKKLVKQLIKTKCNLQSLRRTHFCLSNRNCCLDSPA